MDSQTMKILGIVALVICAVCIFVGIERYNANAKNVRAMNQMQQSIPMGNMPGMQGMQGQMKPATPAATKYAILFALIFGGGGAFLLVRAGSTTQAKPSDSAEA